MPLHCSVLRQAPPLRCSVFIKRPLSAVLSLSSACSLLFCLCRAPALRCSVLCGLLSAVLSCVEHLFSAVLSCVKRLEDLYTYSIILVSKRFQYRSIEVIYFVELRILFPAGYMVVQQECRGYYKC